MHPTQATLADFLFSPRSTWNHVYRLLYSYAVLLSLRISEFPMHIFCPQNTQELPKKHHEAGHNCILMHCHKSIYGLTLDTVKIVKRFACADEQRKGHFGKFE